MNPARHLQVIKPPEANAATPLRYWLREEQWAELDPEQRTLYVLDGDDYRLKPNAGEIHQHKLALLILAGLITIFTVIGIYGTIADKDAANSRLLWSDADSVRIARSVGNVLQRVDRM